MYVKILRKGRNFNFIAILTNLIGHVTEATTGEHGNNFKQNVVATTSMAFQMQLQAWGQKHHCLIQFQFTLSSNTLENIMYCTMFCV